MSVNMNLLEGEIVVPESALLRIERTRDLGSVPGLDDDELADPAELERWALINDWGPILSLPFDKGRSVIRPQVDEWGNLDWGAFGTVDFERLVPRFDKARYKIDRLREELRDAVIMLSIVSERVSSREKYTVMKHLRMGLMTLDEISDEDVRAMGKWYLRVRRIRAEIAAVQAARRRSHARHCLAAGDRGGHRSAYRRQSAQKADETPAMRRCPGCDRDRAPDELIGGICARCDDIAWDAFVESSRDSLCVREAGRASSQMQEEARPQMPGGARR